MPSSSQLKKIPAAAKVRPVIPFADYQRIFQVIKTVLDGVEANTPRACLFFSVVGASIVQKIYKKHCLPMAGAAFFALDGNDNAVLNFGRIADGQVQSSLESFHCWIVCEGQVIDFMAPIFRESLRSGGFDIPCSRKMFQRPLVEMAPGHTDLSQPGDFYLEPNLALTREVLMNFGSLVANRDLTEICLQWYKKPPRTILRNFAIGSDDGSTTNMKLSQLELVGTW